MVIIRKKDTRKEELYDTEKLTKIYVWSIALYADKCEHQHLVMNIILHVLKYAHKEKNNQ